MGWMSKCLTRRRDFPHPPVGDWGVGVGQILKERAGKIGRVFIK